MKVRKVAAAAICLSLLLMLAVQVRSSQAMAVSSPSTTNPPPPPSPPGSGTGSGGIGTPGVSSGVGSGGGSGTTLTGSSGGSSYSPDGSGSTDSSDTWHDNGPAVGFGCSNGQALPLQPESQPAPAVTPESYILVTPTGQEIETELSCPSAGSPGTPPPPPPSLPTPQEATAATPFPPPSFGLNPSLGLTGLASWLWATGVPRVITATASIRGYTVVTTARPVKFYWWFGDGGDETSTSPGSVASPSATHVYQSKGVYSLTLVIAWQGQYTFTGNGVPAQTVPLGTVDQAPATTSYPVQEIRSVLVTPTS
jgi:PKD domain